MTPERLAELKTLAASVGSVTAAGTVLPPLPSAALALGEAVKEVERLRAAIAKHHAQRADDRCQFDDDELYAAAGLPPADRRVGDKAAMLANCKRFIEQRCEAGGPWKSYAELLEENQRLLREAAERMANKSAEGKTDAG